MPTSTRSHTELPAPAPPPPSARQAMERVICPQCASRYRFPARPLSGGVGLKVTCPKCQHKFVAVAPKPVAPTVPFPALAGVDNDILDVWMHGRQQRRRRRVLGVVAGLLLAAFWGLFRGGAEVDVHEAAVAATAVPEVAPAPVRVSPSVAAILGHDQVVEIPASTAVEEAPPAPMVRTASVVPGPTPKPAVAPAPPVDREVAGLHWYTSAMDAKGAGNAALAEKMMLRAVAKAPTRGDWWAELGTLQRDLGKADDAEVSSRRASYLLVNSAE